LSHSLEFLGYHSVDVLISEVILTQYQRVMERRTNRQNCHISIAFFIAVLLTHNKNRGGPGKQP